ncbi:MAG: winged helix-turn-helix domain-containing protein [bacterium]|jgi:restriction endonuclease Mrr|nr:winged helix-turn-helix domain-containing protein [bacterium]
MCFPEYKDMEEPFVCYIYLNGGKNHEIRPCDIYDPLADFFGLTMRDRNMPRPDGYSGTIWKNRVQWLRQRLVNHGYLDGSKKGIWRLTDRGVLLASSVVARYSNQQR